MPFVGGFVFPHGTIPLDPQSRDFSNIPAVQPNSKDECVKLHDAMKTAAADLIKLRPDLIILSTPHGPRLKDNYLFIGNENVSGTAKWDDDWENFKIEFKNDTKTSNFMVDKLRKLNNPVDMFQVGMLNRDHVPLRWGEVVPLWFITEAAKSVPDYQLPPMVLIGQPSKRLTNSKGMIPELLKLGSDICHMITNDATLMEKRIAVVISCDLAHDHSHSSTSPFEFHKDAAPFDDFCVNWAKLDMTAQTVNASSEFLLVSAGNLVDKVRCCGYTGLVLLHGMLQYAVKNGRQFKSHLYHYAVPTYYGMMVNSLI